MAETIVVLGAGIGGYTVATRLREHLGAAHRIVIVERADTFTLGASLLRVLTGERSPEEVKRPTDRLKQRGIEFVGGTVTRIDPLERTITVADRTFGADHVVIALGADLAPHAVPGLSAAGHNLYTVEGAETFRDALQRFKGGKIVLLTGAPIYKCPAAPYEAAMLIDGVLRQRGIRTATALTLYAAEPGPMGVTGPAISKAVRSMIEAKAIAYRPEHQIKQAHTRHLTFANGTEAEFDLLGYVPPHQAPAVVRDAGLCADNGWIAVDRATLATRFERIYAIGDCTGVPLSIGKLLPKAGVFAEGEAEVVADNVAATITGKKPTAAFAGHGECYVETGDGLAGWGTGNFFAEPAPQVTLHAPTAESHRAKELWEQSWLDRW